METETNSEPTALATVDRIALKRACMNLKKIAPRSTKLPALKHAAIRTQNGTLTLRATDLDVTLALQVNGPVHNDGFTSADVREMKKALTNLSTERVTLLADPEGPNLIVVTGDVELTFPSYPEEDFPGVPTFEGQPPEGTLTLSVERWKELSDNLPPYVSTEENRPVLNGVLFENDGNQLHAVATNGHHMMIFEGQYGSNMGRIVPGREFLKPLRPILKRANVRGNATLQAYENHAHLEFNGGEMWIRIIKGPYPNWRMVLPDGDAMVGEARLPRDKLLQAAKTVAGAASDQTHRCVLEMEPDQPMRITAPGTPDGPSVEATVPGSNVTGEPMRIGVNAKYLTEIVKSHTTDELIIRYRDPARAIMVDPEPENGWSSLLMPLRLID